MISWPDDLIGDLACRRAVLFLGAGISMNSTSASGSRPKSWLQLLTDATDKLTLRSAKVVKKLIKQNEYLTACEIVKKEMGKDAYESFLTEEFLTPQFKPAAIHDTIFKIDCRIIATPSIDKIYETRANHLANGSVKVKHYYDDDLADAVRRRDFVVLKVHGTIDAPSKMVFTRGEYARARARNAEFYAILDALVITHTFIFLGCGINDPDIRLVLENYAFRFRNARRHFMTMPKDAISREEIAVVEESTNLKILGYSSRDGHKELIDSITDLQQQVDQKRTDLSASMKW